MWCDIWWLCGCDHIGTCCPIRLVSRVASIEAHGRIGVVIAFHQIVEMDEDVPEEGETGQTSRDS